MLKYILNLSEQNVCNRVISAKTRPTSVAWCCELVLCSWGSLSRLLTKLILQNIRRGGKKMSLSTLMAWGVKQETRLSILAACCLPSGLRASHHALLFGRLAGQGRAHSSCSALGDDEVRFLARVDEGSACPHPCHRSQSATAAESQQLVWPGVPYWAPYCSAKTCFCPHVKHRSVLVHSFWKEVVRPLYPLSVNAPQWCW